MKVKKLIEELKKQPQNKDVWILLPNDFCYDIREVDYDGDGDVVLIAEEEL